MSTLTEHTVSPGLSKEGGADASIAKRSQIGPNSYLRALSLRSSTFLYVDFGDSLIDHASFRNTRLNRCALEGVAISGSQLDQAHIENSSLRGVVIENCDIEGLVINGVHVGDLLSLLQTGRRGK